MCATCANTVNQARATPCNFCRPSPRHPTPTPGRGTSCRGHRDSGTVLPPAHTCAASSEHLPQPVLQPSHRGNLPAVCVTSGTAAATLPEARFWEQQVGEGWEGRRRSVRRNWCAVKWGRHTDISLSRQGPLEDTAVCLATRQVPQQAPYLVPGAGGAPRASNCCRPHSDFCKPAAGTGPWPSCLLGSLPLCSSRLH